MDNLWSVMDLIFVGAAVYIFYSCYQMKKTGEIKKEFLMNNELNLKKCKDKEGYIAFMCPKLLVFGVACLLEGASGLINSYVQPLGSFYYVAMALFMAVLIWYAVQSRKGIAKFW